MTKPHRTQAAREQREVEKLLQTAPFVYVAVVDGDGPYVVPMSFAFETVSGGPVETAGRGGKPGRLYLHTGPGRKSDALAGDPRVCVAVATDVAFGQGPSPCEDGFFYRSVVVKGRARLLDGALDRERALRAIVAKYDPAAAAMPFEERLLAQTLIYEVAIDELTFKERPR
ncbi:MAG: pyridoxamine 5'-phosphate oxidase family protein [Thermoleophilia bacterium]|nr:pyridoxamine 5'-phosphate oxidase family protein [Thermoleophilia bacterium]